MATTHEMKVGMIRLDYWKKNILRSLHSLGLIHTACDANQGTIDLYKNDYPDIEAVFIFSPASTHYEIAKQALNVDKNIFVEKPLSLKVTEGQDGLSVLKVLESAEHSLAQPV